MDTKNTRAELSKIIVSRKTRIRDEQKKAIYNEFNISEESLQRDVTYFIEWLEEQPHTPNVKDRLFLRSVLIRFKNSLERTKNSLDLYYSIKTIDPHVLSNLDACSVGFKKSHDLLSLTPMPKLTAEGYRVMVFRIQPHDASMLPSVEEVCDAAVIHWLMLMRLAPSKGAIVIVDCKTYSLQSMYRYRVHKSYKLHMSPALHPLVSLLRKLRKKDLGSREVLWNNRAEDLKKEIGADVLLSDYGGNLQSIKELEGLWFEEIIKHNDLLIADNENIADIKKRPRGPPTIADVADCGLTGTFREINID